MSVASSNTSVVQVDSAIVTIDSGTVTNSRAHLTPVDTGTATITFSAAGQQVLDSLTITVVTPKLQFSFVNGYLGRRQHGGQYFFYVQTPDYRVDSLVATIRQLHASVDTLSTTAPVILPSSYYSYLDAFGLLNGTDTLILSAPGYLPDTATLTVTTPEFGSGSLPSTTTTTNPPISVNVWPADSLGSQHYAMDSVAFAAVPSDSGVVLPTQSYFRILKDANLATATVNVVGAGTASLTFSDSAGVYLPKTTNAMTVTGPSLSISNGAPVLGMRQSSGPYGMYVQAPNAVASPLVVNLSSTDPTVATVPASVTIPTGSYYTYFTVTAQDTTATILVKASATGYGLASTSVQVTRPKFVVSTSSQLNTTSPPAGITVYATDNNGTQHPTTDSVAVTLVSASPTVALVDSSTVTILPGNSSASGATWTPGLIGTTTITASDTRPVFYNYNAGTATVTVVTPSLSFGSQPGALGLGQYQDYVYVQGADYQKADLAVAFTHTGAARTETDSNLTSTPIAGVTIPQGQYYTYFRLVGIGRGTDTLTASATSPAHNPYTLYTVVDSGRVDPLNGWQGSIAVGDSTLITLYVRDPNTSARYTVSAAQFTLVPNSNIEFHVAGTVVTQVTVPAGTQYVQFYLIGKTAGTGTVTITSPEYKTYANTVTVQ